MSVVRAPCRIRYAAPPSSFPQIWRVSGTAATAHHVSEIKACHGNEFEKSGQKSCQLRSIAAAAARLQHLRCSWRRKPGCRLASCGQTSLSGLVAYFLVPERLRVPFLQPPPPSSRGRTGGEREHRTCGSYPLCCRFCARRRPPQTLLQRPLSSQTC